MTPPTARSPRLLRESSKKPADQHFCVLKIGPAEPIERLAHVAHPTHFPQETGTRTPVFLNMAGSPSIASLFAQRIVIGVGDLAVSNNTEVILSTYALGSCVGVVAFDPAVRVGGILHLMLPESSLAPEKAVRQPAMFADTGLTYFFRQLVGLKALPSRLNLLVAGGACVLSGTDNFKIGERNVRATLDLLTRSGCRPPIKDVGGFHNRTLHLDMNTACVTLKTPQSSSQCTLAS